MEREARIVEATIPNGEAESGVIDTTWAAGMGIKTPAALEATTVIGFKVCESKDGTFLPLYDETNALLTVTVELAEARAYVAPDGLFAWRYVKLWAQAAGVDVDQTADRDFVIVLKS